MRALPVLFVVQFCSLDWRLRCRLPVSTPGSTGDSRLVVGTTTIRKSHHSCLERSPYSFLWPGVVIAYGPLVLMRRIGRSERSRLRSPVWRIVICSVGLVSADLFLDPLATSVHAWTWYRGGVYFGVPLSNFWGWFVVGLLIYTPYFCICERAHVEHNYRKAFYDGCYVASSCVLLCLAMVAVWLRLRSVVPIVAAAITFTPMIAYWYIRTIPGSGLATRVTRMLRLAEELE